METIILPEITRFGRLLVLQKEAPDASGNARWKCVCDCGNSRTILAKSLKSGDTKSCGCAHRLRPYEHLYKRLLWRGKKFGIEVGITYEDFLVFTETKTCYYCDDPIEWTTHKHTKTTTSAYNLDRLRGNEGYVSGNLVVCCRPCNLSRGKFTPEEWKAMILAVKQYRNKEKHRDGNFHVVLGNLAKLAAQEEPAISPVSMRVSPSEEFFLDDETKLRYQNPLQSI